MEINENLVENENLEEKIISISALAEKIKKNLESDFTDITIRGEVGKVTSPPSGHVYLDLKDDGAVINSIIWKYAKAKIDFQPQMGMEVIACGKVTTYAPRSNYQFVISELRQAGQGALMAMFVKRRQKLSDEGLFSPEHKKTLPYLPEHIGLITSLKGAVLQDMISRMRVRFPVHFTIWPVLVQGKEAANQVKEAVIGFDKLVNKPQILIIARGGGSFEDLWAFNDEDLVRAIFACKVPVISAIGHETDWSLCDMVSDIRASTPTAAIEIALPSRDKLLEEVEQKRTQLAQIKIIKNARKKLVFLGNEFKYKVTKISFLRQRLDYAWQNLSNKSGFINLKVNKLANLKFSFKKLFLQKLIQKLKLKSDQYLRHLSLKRTEILAHKKRKVEYLTKLLASLSYQNILQRGFAIIKNEKGKVFQSIKQFDKNQNIKIILQDGQIDTRVSVVKDKHINVKKLQQKDFFN